MMGKRGLIQVLTTILALVLLLCSTASALHTAEASIDPPQIYETNVGTFYLNVKNNNTPVFSLFNIFQDDSKGSINDVEISYLDFTLLTSTLPSDWARILSTGLLTYSTEIGGISSQATQPFGIEMRADKIDVNTTSQWTITTTDFNNETSQTLVEILIINDDTAPVLNDNIPFNGMFIKNGTTDQLTQINATDPETGIAQVNFNWVDCAEYNITPNNSTMLSEVSDDIFSSTADLSAYEDGTLVCFSFNAANNGGEISYVSGNLTIDGTVPNVDLIAPDDGELMNSQSDFEFNATDNLAPILDCNLTVKTGLTENVEASVIANNGDITSISVANISEGEHEWSVTCADLAGWITESETRSYILDKTPPNITLVNPDDGDAVAEGTIIEVSVTDNYEMGTVEYLYDSDEDGLDEVYSANDTFTINTTGRDEGWFSLTVNAQDKAGNNNSADYMFAIDKSAPEITLISPQNASSTPYDVHVDFVFNVTDTYDPLPHCRLYLNGSLIDSDDFNISDMPAVFQEIIMPGNYKWKIECEDDAGKVAETESWILDVVDLSGPDITIDNIGTVPRGQDILINSTITDISDVDASSVTIEVTDADGITTQVSVTNDGDSYYGYYTTTSDNPLGDYDIEVYAEDTKGNNNTATAGFTLTYAYAIDLVLTPASLLTSSQSTASGTVTMDNGSDVPETQIELQLPGTTIMVDLVDGEFSHLFSAPGSAGNYDVTASITPENNFTFSDTENLQVNARSVSGSNGGGGGCNTIWQCTEWSQCTLDSQERKCEKEIPGCAAGPKPSELRQCDAVENDNTDEQEKEPIETDSSDWGELYDDECQKDSDCGNGKKCNNGKCIGQSGNLTKTKGVGKATGIFSSSILSSMLLWVLLLILIILFLLSYVSKNGMPFKEKGLKRNKDKLGLDDYLNKR